MLAGACGGQDAFAVNHQHIVALLGHGLDTWQLGIVLSVHDSNHSRHVAFEGWGSLRHQCHQRVRVAAQKSGSSGVGTVKVYGREF